MKEQTFYPADHSHLTAIHILSRTGKFTHLIYLSLIAVLVVLMTLLPFCHTDVTVRSPGILRPATEISSLKAVSAGVVQSFPVHDNESVARGQLICEIISPVLEEKMKFQRKKLLDICAHQNDIRLLTRSNLAQSHLTLNTPLYTQAFRGFLQKQSEKQLHLRKARLDFLRAQKLFQEKVIAAQEFEQVQFQFEQAASDIRLLQQTQLSTWHQDQTAYTRDSASCADQLRQIESEVAGLHIYAPVEGVMQTVAGIYSGSTVLPGQEVARLSPNTELHAEVLVSPRDVGLLHTGMEVKMQVSAFRHHDWGLASGRITEISSDVQIRDNQPVYPIRCSLNASNLKLKNGHTGTLKKGMTLEARFVITRRTLWQLLYDRVDDWLNPSTETMKSS